MWNISQTFIQELRKPDHQIAARATMLDSAFREIPDGDFFTKGANDFQDFIVDGNVDIDQSRGTRRTGSLTIINEDGGFSPDGGLTDYDGKFYVNRVVRLYRGVTISGGTTLYAPIGTFMVDVIDTFVERNMSTVNLTLSDHWKKFTKSLVTRTKVYAVGTHFNTIVRDFAALAGADYPLAPALDPLTGTGRSSANTTLQTKLTLERGTNRGETLKDLANRFGVDLYFNVEGRLVSNDRKDPKDAQEVWHFYSSTKDSPFGMLNSVRRTLTDDNLYNHIFVIGLGNEKLPVIYERKNTSAASFMNTSLIGDRVQILENQRWKTQAQVDAAGQKLWDRSFNLFEEVEIDVICNPALEGDDVIKVTEPTSRVNNLYRILQMNVPLTTSKQTIRLVRNIYA